MSEDTAKVEEKRTPSSTDYKIEGDLIGVFREITNIFRRWPALGYGTRVQSIEAVYPNDGLFAARMSRANSAD